MDLLFRRGSLSDFIEQQKLDLKSEIESLPTSYILKESGQDLFEQLVSKYRLKVPVIHHNAVYVGEPKDIDIDVSHEPGRDINKRQRPFFVKGTSITIIIPYNGDGRLFQYQPLSFNYDPPCGEVVGEELHLVYESTDHDASTLKQKYKREIEKIEMWLTFVTNDVESYNNTLENFTRSAVAKRKNKLLDDQKMVEDLGIPKKRHNYTARTYTIPNSNKKTKVQYPKEDPISKTSPDSTLRSVNWDVFICHASEDKDAFVRPLAKKLGEQGLQVWYDEFTLLIGDSLRRSIDKGLANSRYGIVILSKHFFEKEWPQKELDGLVAREIGGKKVILPVWHGITRADVERYSPILADRVSCSSDKGLEYIVVELMRAIKG